MSRITDLLDIISKKVNVHFRKKTLTSNRIVSMAFRYFPDFSDCNQCSNRRGHHWSFPKNIQENYSRHFLKTDHQYGPLSVQPAHPSSHWRRRKKEIYDRCLYAYILNVVFLNKDFVFYKPCWKYLANTGRRSETQSKIKSTDIHCWILLQIFSQLQHTKKTLLGFEPRSWDSKSQVITTTL